MRHTGPVASRTLTLAAEAWIDLLACRARLRMPRLLAAESLLRRELRGSAPRVAVGASRDVLLRAFRRALATQPGTPGCLPRSLALRRFLARHGEPGQINLGLKRTGGQLRGHAWVEVAGTIVSDDEAFVRSFARLSIARNAVRP